MPPLYGIALTFALTNQGGRVAVILRRVNAGTTYVNGRTNDVFAQARSGDPTDYAFVEVFNSGPDALPAGKVWLTLDTSGAAVTVAVADATPRAGTFTYSVTASSLTYTAPTTKTAGLDTPALASGEKCLIALRRVLTGATAASPETNRLNYATV
jgi:hypothetical protein